MLYGFTVTFDPQIIISSSWSPWGWWSVPDFAEFPWGMPYVSNSQQQGGCEVRVSLTFDLLLYRKIVIS